MYYVYVLLSRKDNHMYIGFSADMEKRLRAHNAGKVRSTKSRRPFVLVYFENYSFESEALNREKYLKSGIGREFIKDKIRSVPAAM